MPITVIVCSAAGDDARLTFDGMQRVVIGRGASCDVRLPDASVSHRHALLRAQGSDFVLIDEGSTNGTFVGDVRVAPHTSRIVRSGDAVRVGRVWLELRIDQSPITRDVAATTRELALAMVSRAMAQRGSDLSPKVLVVEGADQGARLVLEGEERTYLLGRGAHCDLPLADVDASREHASLVRRTGAIFVRDLGAKNGVWLGGARVPADRDSVWRPSQMLQVGRSVLALEEPVGDTLARIESGPDEALPPGEPASEQKPPSPGPADPPSPEKPSTAGVEREEAVPKGKMAAPTSPSVRRRRRARLSIPDLVVIGAAVAVLALSAIGLFWLLRG
jgi:pSer/pThr/pTyr-binding forkhead associated (FHA) protein